jgi:pseudouridine-5'-monophosphatase
MDGLLIDSEDAYTLVTNQILHENNRPSLPWSIKAQLQGRPGPAAGKIFMEWAQLPISQEAFLARQKELQAEAFKKCKPLPGVQNLLTRLEGAHTKIPSFGRSPSGGGKKVRLALATSSHGRNYEIKTAHMQKLFSVFPHRQKIMGDDERIPKGRGKPLPDIYLLALQTINEGIDAEGDGERHVSPEECLVFEDSVPGIEAGRRAGMRVLWCPHPGLLEVYSGREEEVLAGRTGEHKEEDLEHVDSKPLLGSPGQVGELRDGWAEMLSTLEDFDYQKYGIDFSDTRYRTESGQSAVDGTTDRELEEMTAKADGKLHAPEEEGVRPLPSPIPGILESKV